MNEELNMSMRKFLKQVGVTSQKAIEDAVAAKGGIEGESFEARVTLTIEGLDLTHTVTGTIKG
ncbi:hypothetical protein SAMN05421759_10816 [Roseivivax lentus]|uniref:Uncharacterized protein n=1 Tax=Roseivivax lentus TaxID=633194 RepID=A0A1N7NEI7_9RHOB|nr:DUF6494 family protein [Roseivivax lentus]SIS96775.1 hypothetical protein SAMN05421759_10816 [Roseivivax lentus]